MSMRELEAAMLAELKVVAANPKIKMKDVMEWQTGQSLKAQDGETLFYLPKLGISCAVKLPPISKRAAQPAGVADPLRSDNSSESNHAGG